MCSWCWAFRPTYENIFSSLPADIKTKNILGGLAPDTDEPMPEDLRKYVQNQWKKIQQQVNGIEFNFEFWNKCQPRRSTYPACRAVIASRNQDPDYEDKMVQAIQRGYYLDARNPSDTTTLLEFAREIGLNIEQFQTDLNSPDTEKTLQQEIKFSRELGISSFPSLVLETANRYQQLTIVYNEPEIILAEINNSIISV